MYRNQKVKIVVDGSKVEWKQIYFFKGGFYSESIDERKVDFDAWEDWIELIYYSDINSNVEVLFSE